MELKPVDKTPAPAYPTRKARGFDLFAVARHAAVAVGASAMILLSGGVAEAGETAPADSPVLLAEAPPPRVAGGRTAPTPPPRPRPAGSPPAPRPPPPPVKPPPPPGWTPPAHPPQPRAVKPPPAPPVRVPGGMGAILRIGPDELS